MQGEPYDLTAHELIEKVSKVGCFLHDLNGECAIDPEFHMLPILHKLGSSNLQDIHHGILFHIPDMRLLDMVQRSRLHQQR